MSRLRELRDNFVDAKEAFKDGINEDLKANNKKNKDLIKYLIAKTGKKDSTVRTLLSDKKIDDDMMDFIEEFVYGGKDERDNNSRI